MKEKELIDVMEVDENLDYLYEQYTTYTKMESELRKKKAEIKDKLLKHFEESGDRDDFGNVWLATGKGNFKREIRRKYSIDPTFADPILKRLGLYDKVVSFEPTYDVDVLQNYIADGTVSESDVSKIFKVEESYAIKTEKRKEEEGTAES